MKGMDIFCASQAATAIRLSNMDNENDPHGSSLSSSSTTIHLGGSSGRAIDRYNPIIRDARRFGKTIPHHHHIIPSSCSSQSQLETISPIPLLHSHQNNHNTKKATNAKHSSSEQKKEKSDDHNRTSTARNKKKKIINKGSLDITTPPRQSYEEKRKTNAGDEGRKDFPNRNDRTANFTASTRKIWSFTSTTSPAGSSRYLLSSDQNQTPIFNVISDFDPVLKLEEEETSKSHPPASTLPEYESPRSPSDQVVVLRVSLHCRGCERKMRKHISRMEGVSSFNIDFAAKKVTVVGNVTPLGVLASISKVKNAQLWAPATTATRAHSSSDISKNNLSQAPTTTVNSS